MASNEKLFSGLSDGSSLGRSVIAFGMPLNIRGKYWGNMAFALDSLSLSGVYSEGRKSLGYGRLMKENIWGGK